MEIWLFVILAAPTCFGIAWLIVEALYRAVALIRG